MYLFFTLGKSRVSLCTLLVDASRSTTCMLPIYEGYWLPHAAYKMDVGGTDITNLLRQKISLKCGKDYGLAVAREAKENFCYVAEDYEGDLKKTTKSDEITKM